MNNERKALTMAAIAMTLTVGAALIVNQSRAVAVHHESQETGSGVAKTSHGSGGAVWGANYFPNIPLVTHDGRTVHFFDDLIKGKVVAINFIYTTCPDSCPTETARLLQTQRLLGDRMGKDVFFYSITIDPEHDTQPVLAKYVEDWQIGPGWTFLTGKEQDIILLRRKLGLYIEEIQAPDSNDHNLSLIIGNQATGQWMKRSPFENAYVLANDIGGQLHNFKLARKATQGDYSQAPELRSISKGESLFRTRCSSCHTIGEGDVSEPSARKIGPDLYKITERRDHEWLVSWLAAPDDVLAKKDPIAMDLFNKYNRVSMPNMQLNQIEIQALLEHIEERSAQIARHVAMGHHPDPLANRHAEHHHHDPQAQHQADDLHTGL